MRKKFLRTMALAVAATLLLTACSSGGGSSAGESSSSAAESSTPTSSTAEASGTTSEDTGSGEESYLCSDEPLELTAHIHWGNVYVLSDDWTVTNEAAKMTNISLKGTASPMETDSTEAFNLMIAGQDIPDIVGGNRDLINQYGMEGAFMPLNDLIEEYAPDFKKILDENPDIKGAITAADGNIYQIPFVYESLVSEAWFVRQDWLDAVGMEAPTTVDELHDVLTAFVNEDPNGNGQKDEVGYFTRLTNTDNVLKGLLSLFGIQDARHTDEEGNVGVGLYSEEYKEAIKSVSQWYAEGLIDPEIFTRGSNARDILFPENNGGVIHDWIPSTTGYNEKLQESVPGFKVVGILPPTDVNGDQWEVEARARLSGAGWAIGANNEHPEETMKYMNFWWTEAGRRLQTYGVEGDTYTMVDGEPVYTDKVLNATNPINDYMRQIGGQIEDMASLHDNSYERFMSDEEGNRVTKMYEESGLVNKMNVKLPAVSFTQEELDVVNSNWQPCRNYMLEQLQKWTFDGSTIDAEFDQYMANLKSMGIEDVIAAYQSAYDRLMEAAE